MRKQKLKHTCDDILNDKINIVEGCRILSRFESEIAAISGDILRLVLWFEDETEEYPQGQVRGVYSKEYLQKLDEEYLPFIKENESSIKIACQKINNFLAENSHES